VQLFHLAAGSQLHAYLAPDALLAGKGLIYRSSNMTALARRAVAAAGGDILGMQAVEDFAGAMAKDATTPYAEEGRGSGIEVQDGQVPVHQEDVRRHGIEQLAEQNLVAHLCYRNAHGSTIGNGRVACQYNSFWFGERARSSAAPPRRGARDLRVLESRSAIAREGVVKAKSDLMKQIFSALFALVFAMTGQCQDGKITFTSDDTTLVKGFEWAKKQTLAYVNRGNDPVGHWYEAALPGRSAFCMRDVSHQLVGAQMLGLADINKNLLTKFVSVIAESRDWCGYWEIDKWNHPAPVDYKNDQDFWYNLPANFDILDACLRAYQWTGDTAYLNDPIFIRYYEATLNDYVKRWDPDGDGLMEGTKTGPSRRGLSSYNEEKFGKVGVDLLAGQFVGYRDYATMLKLRGLKGQAADYTGRAEKMRTHLNTVWWDSKAGLYHHYIQQDGTWLDDKQMMSFLLRWDVVPAERAAPVLDHLLSVYQQSGVEMNTYYPLEFYRYGKPDKAYALLVRLMSPELKRREYPEVSYAVLETLAMGLMGIQPDAASRSVTTTARLALATKWVELSDMPLFDGTITVRHEGATTSTLANHTREAITWHARGPNGKTQSFVVKPGDRASFKDLPAKGKT